MNELRMEIDRKDRELNIVKEQLRKMPQPRTNVNEINNRNYNNNNSNNRNMYMKNRADGKFNLFQNINLQNNARVNNNNANNFVRNNYNRQVNNNNRNLPTFQMSSPQNRPNYGGNSRQTNVASQRSASRNMSKNGSEKRLVNNYSTRPYNNTSNQGIHLLY